MQVADMTCFENKDAQGSGEIQQGDTCRREQIINMRPKKGQYEGGIFIYLLNNDPVYIQSDRSASIRIYLR